METIFFWRWFQMNVCLELFHSNKSPAVAAIYTFTNIYIFGKNSVNREHILGWEGAYRRGREL